MSLDVFLTLIGYQPTPQGPTIFVREHGQTKVITREEWDSRFPHQEPITFDQTVENQVYRANITHNLNRMAQEAGLYEALWRPEEVGITTAQQLIAPLTAGLERLEADPAYFMTFNPANGWGSYEILLKFIQEYLFACQDYPEAEVSVSR